MVDKMRKLLLRSLLGLALALGVVYAPTALHAQTTTGSWVPLSKGGCNGKLTDPGSDKILFWDDSAGKCGFLTLPAGMTITGTTLGLTDVTFSSVTVGEEAYDATGWDADLTTPTKNAVRDKIETLSITTQCGADPNADRFAFWDDSAGACGWASPPTEGIAFSGTTLILTNDLAALEALASTGIARRTGTDTWSAGTTVAINEGGSGQVTAPLALGAFINGATEDTAPDYLADFLGTYDASGATGKKVLLGNIAPYFFKNLAADDVNGANSTSAQPWFPTNGGVSVAGSTTYLAEGSLHLSRSAGTTSHTTSVLFGGTATLTSIRGSCRAKTGDTTANAAVNSTIIDVATALIVKAASTSATEQIALHCVWSIRTNGAGTLIPQFQYSAAPGGAPTVKANSFFTMTPLGTSSVDSNGTWQ